MQQITPKSLILSMLQMSGVNAMPVKTLVEIGEIFGFAGNTVRVTTTRLIREGSVESDERGLYRLSKKSESAQRFIERWKEGENRIKQWDGHWLCFLANQKPLKKQAKSEQKFGFSGFMEGLPNLWVRPNNLTAGIEEIKQFLAKTGKLEKGEMFVGMQFEEKTVEKWSRFLWPIDELLEQQKTFLSEMNRSIARIEKMPTENALVESYLIGSEAVRQLIIDPLLPQEIMSNQYRVAITEAMLVYDEIGKRIWSNRFNALEVSRVPSNLHLVTKAM